jgi:hypothetical protein
MQGRAAAMLAASNSDPLMLLSFVSFHCSRGHCSVKNEGSRTGAQEAITAVGQSMKGPRGQEGKKMA